MAKSPSLLSARTAARRLTAGRASGESCGEWNTLSEEDTNRRDLDAGSIRSKRRGRTFALENADRKEPGTPRGSRPAWANSIASPAAASSAARYCWSVAIPDRQIDLAHAGHQLMARAGHRVVLHLRRRGGAQVRLRAERLGLADAPVQLAAGNLGRGHRLDPVGRRGAAPAS